MNPTQQSLNPNQVASPFERTRNLLEGIEPGQDVIDMSIGEPRHPFPDFVGDVLRKTAGDFGKYPPIRGTDALRSAIVDWHGLRYPDLRSKLDPDTNLLVLNGSREGLFSAVFTARFRRIDIERPAVLIPNPFYQCYHAGAVSAGAEPIFLPTSRLTKFLPDLSMLSSAVLERTIAFFLCSPSNPQGAIADQAYLQKAMELARTYDFMLFADECYSEIYSGNPPEGALQVSFRCNGNFNNVISFNSLSKRSNLPGLRSGFAAGDPTFIDAYLRFRNVAGPQIPLPLQAVSEKLWREETHVEQSRKLYKAKFDAAGEILKQRFGYERPDGGFFLWLDMSRFGGSETATKILWRDCGVKVIPGAYIVQGSPDDWGDCGDYVRIALVQDLPTTKTALKRIINRLGLQQ